MATVSEWIAGARPQTLPAAVAPVLAGTAAAANQNGANWVYVLWCLLVALLLQIGVNYANDYSDGIRGTDNNRIGPQRLVGSGVAKPKAVKFAAWICFSFAALFGLLLVVSTGIWWLILIGIAAILAAWFYTGGKHPYGYLGLGEIFVFVFFGLVAGCGTTLVQLGRITWASLAAAVAIGLLACNVLIVNNLRDIETDSEAGKITLATILGDKNTRILFGLFTLVALVCVVIFAKLTSWWSLFALLGMFPILFSLKILIQGIKGKGLIVLLKTTGFAELGVGIGLLAGCLC